MANQTSNQQVDKTHIIKKKVDLSVLDNLASIPPEENISIPVEIIEQEQEQTEQTKVSIDNPAITENQDVEKNTKQAQPENEQVDKPIESHENETTETETKEQAKGKFDVDPPTTKEMVLAILVSVVFIFIVMLFRGMNEAITSYSSGQQAANEAVRQGNVTTILRNQSSTNENTPAVMSAPAPFHTILLPKDEKMVDSGIMNNGDIWTKSTDKDGNTVIRTYLSNGNCTSAVVFKKDN